MENKQTKEEELIPIDENYFKEKLINHPDTNKCSDSECIICGYRDCPYNEPLHYHHDGCPVCCFED